MCGYLADIRNKYPDLFLWDMTFAAGETKTLHVGYILPMSFAGGTTRKLDDPEKILNPQYEKPWHARIEGCMVVFFSYITETGQSWAGPIEKATFRVRNTVFEDGLRRFPEYRGRQPGGPSSRHGNARGRPRPGRCRTDAWERFCWGNEARGGVSANFARGMEDGIHPGASPRRAETRI